MNPSHNLNDTSLNAGAMLQEIIEDIQNPIATVKNERGVEYISLSGVSNVISLCQSHWLVDHNHLVNEARTQAQAQADLNHQNRIAQIRLEHANAFANQLAPVLERQLKKLQKIEADISPEAYQRLVQMIQSMTELPTCELCGQHGHTTSYCWFNSQLYNLCSKDKLAKPAYDTFRAYVAFVAK